MLLLWRPCIGLKQLPHQYCFLLPPPNPSDRGLLINSTSAADYFLCAGVGVLARVCMYIETHICPRRR